MRRRALFAAAAIFFAAAAARAEVGLQKIGWELAKKPAARKFEAVAALKLDGGKIAGKLRAKLSLLNRGPRPVEGILLHYSLTARLAPLAGKNDPVWAVAFLLEERRVPKVGPNQVQDVMIDPSAALELYLRKIQRGGFVPDRIKLDVMIEPHPGDNLPIQTLDSELKLER